MTVRIGLIGCGAIGRAHAQAVAGLAGATLVAVADVDQAVAEGLAAEHGVTPVLPAELTAPGVVDLAVVATPPSSRVTIVEPLLRAGVAVFCEKPIATDLTSARRLRDLAEETGTPLSLATKFRFVADVADTRRLLAEGRIGKLLKVEVAFSGVADMTRRWNADPDVSGGGVIIDNATHGIDLVHHVVGPITEVFACTGPNAQGLPVEDSATVLARTSSGVLAQIDVTWSFRRPGDEYLTLLGSHGAISIGWGQAKLLINDEPASVFGSGYRKAEALQRNLAAAVGTLTGTAPDVLAGPADAVAAAAAVDAAYASLKYAGWAVVDGPR